MSTQEVAALAAAGVATIAAAALVLAALRLRAAARDLRSAAAVFRRDAVPLVEEMRHAVRTAGFEIDRVDAIVTGAEAVTERVDSASRAAYRTFANPVVKVVAAGTGTRRMFSRLRRGSGTAGGEPGARGSDGRRR